MGRGSPETGGGDGLAAPAQRGDDSDYAECSAAEETRAVRRVSRRLLPLLMATSTLTQLTRGNLAYAALTFNRDNGFSSDAFSLGAALFFVSFGLFQVPSNLVMVRVGLRPWLAFQLAAGGAVASAFALVRGPAAFYALRVALGVLQAGTLPACWHAIGAFFPENHTTKPFALLTIGMLLANLLGAPLSIGMLAMEGTAGLHGWQWVFLLQGLMCVALGALVLALLPSDVATARFLAPSERAALAAAVALGAERLGAPGPAAAAVWTVGATLRAVGRVVCDRRLWLVFACATLVSVPYQTFLVYTPIIAQNLVEGTALSARATIAVRPNASPLLATAISTAPWALAVAASYLVAASSQRRDELFGHITVSIAVSGLSLALFSVAARSAAAGFVLLSISLAANSAANGPAITLMSRLCRGPDAVVAMPLFSTFTVIGGVAGPLLTGALLGRLGGFRWTSVILGTMLLATGVLVVLLRAVLARSGDLAATASASKHPAARVPANGGGCGDSATSIQQVGGGCGESDCSGSNACKCSSLSVDQPSSPAPSDDVRTASADIDSGTHRQQQQQQQQPSEHVCIEVSRAARAPGCESPSP